MADSCGKCIKSLKTAKSKVQCVDCKSVYHPKCVDLTADDLRFMDESQQLWRCDPCAQVRRRSMRLDSKSDVTYDDILKLFNDLRSDFKRVEDSLGSSLSACHDELADTKSTIAKQTEEISSWMAKVEVLTAENSSMSRRIKDLEARLDDSEQYSRRNTVEIHGIAMEKGENVMGLVRAVGRAVAYPLEDSMIDACHRLPGRTEGRPPAIVVKMVRRIDADELVRKRRVKRDLSTHDLGLTSRPAVPVYVNESLTSARRRLLGAARQAKREKHFKYLWIRNGKILLRKNDGDRVIVVAKMEDLNSL